jgi:hypothetical protein
MEPGPFQIPAFGTFPARGRDKASEKTGPPPDDGSTRPEVFVYFGCGFME